MVNVEQGRDVAATLPLLIAALSQSHDNDLLKHQEFAFFCIYSIRALNRGNFYMLIIRTTLAVRSLCSVRLDNPET